MEKGDGQARRPLGDERPPARRLWPAGSVLLTLLIALALASFFNAAAMRRTALEQPFGLTRSMRLALVRPLASLSHALYLDRPARLMAAALGEREAPPPELPAHPPVAKPSGGPGDGRPSKPAAPALPVAGPRPTVRRPLRIYIAGDSMAGIPGMALANLARETKVMKTRLDYKVSSGLCRPDFFDWPARIAGQVRDYRPGAAVVMFGANDRQGVETPSGKVYLFETTGWKKEYRRRVDEVITELFDGDVRRIYWVGQPIMPDAVFSRQMRVVNKIYEQAAEHHPGVRYVDAYGLLADGRGEYAAYLKDENGHVTQVREGDGTHFTYAGGARLAQAVLTYVKADWLPPIGKTGKASPRPEAAATP